MTRHAEEDYIKFIYEYGVNQSETVQVKHIAAYFNYSDQSVYEMVKKLQDQELVIYQPYKGITLSKKGNQEAIRMIRSHRIWEVFLKEYLDYSWEEVHDEAELLEHASSDKLLQRLYVKLGSPKTCQHGNPIPEFDGRIEHQKMIALADVKEGDSFKILKVLG
ncbi:MAG: metal-dependent transcriptional regulator, partial [Acholeplasmataceae bacterium]